MYATYVLVADTSRRDCLLGPDNPARLTSDERSLLSLCLAGMPVYGTDMKRIAQASGIAPRRLTATRMSLEAKGLVVWVKRSVGKSLWRYAMAVTTVPWSLPSTADIGVWLQRVHECGHAQLVPSPVRGQRARERHPAGSQDVPRRAPDVPRCVHTPPPALVVEDPSATSQPVDQRIPAPRVPVDNAVNNSVDLGGVVVENEVAVTSVANSGDVDQPQGSTDVDPTQVSTYERASHPEGVRSAARNVDQPPNRLGPETVDDVDEQQPRSDDETRRGSTRRDALTSKNMPLRQRIKPERITTVRQLGAYAESVADRLLRRTGSDWTSPVNAHHRLARSPFGDAALQLCASLDLPWYRAPAVVELLERRWTLGQIVTLLTDDHPEDVRSVPALMYVRLRMALSGTLEPVDPATAMSPSLVKHRQLVPPPPPRRPPWCGTCDEPTRMLNMTDPYAVDPPTRCPECHPRARADTAPAGDLS